MANIITPNPSATAATSTANIYHDFAAKGQYASPLFITGGILLVIALILFLPAIFRKRPSLARSVIASLFLGCGVIAIGGGAYLESSASRVSQIFSTHAMLASEWTSYKDNFLIATGSSTARTVDTGKNDVTTSEGESYTMLRAAWIDDQSTFDESWKWTQENLQRPDHVFSWLYGQKPDGTYGILTAQGGENTASDADSDIALALLFAYGRWQEPQYLTAARQVISGIWAADVIEIAGKPYLAADNVEKGSRSTVAAIDPSYFAPYTYRIFAQVDSSHPWTALMDDSYDVINRSMDSNLGGGASADLPPDWIGIDKTTGAIVSLGTTTADTNYGYDAIRLPWRLALDWEWNKDARDKQILDKMGFLASQWNANGSLATVYGHDGSVAGDYESPAAYGGDIGFFIVSDPSEARAVYEDKLVILFDPGTADWKVPLGYYDSNWAWFGTALYDGQLPNLASSLSSGNG